MQLLLTCRSLSPSLSAVQGPPAQSQSLRSIQVSVVQLKVSGVIEGSTDKIAALVGGGWRHLEWTAFSNFRDGLTILLIVVQQGWHLRTEYQVPATWRTIRRRADNGKQV
ncbi:Hypothetical predicted protein [Podarcis lilfordi]|uniref:Uncharacterized protein n=1 Tax=Podarcis lilfordi TaxID=74358 RepID=A0AA35KTW8_9SAUR|nr:Hypothetical predicted protein [Podarcis lilfordi]